jgi:hypothetical protein
MGTQVHTMFPLKPFGVLLFTFSLKLLRGNQIGPDLYAVFDLPLGKMLTLGHSDVFAK